MTMPAAPPPNRIEEALQTLTTKQVERVRVLYASLQEGLLTLEEFVRVVVNFLVMGNAAGYALGAGMARSVIEAETGVVDVLAPTPNLPKHLDVERLTQAVETVVADVPESPGEETGEAVDTRLARLADNEPKQAASDGSHDVIRESEQVRGWVRDINADACELCVWLKKAHLRPGGYIYPADQPMHRHTGCVCEQTPVVKGRRRPTRRSKHD